MRVGVKVGQWGWTWGELSAGWRAAERAGFAMVSCWDHAVAAPAGLAAWDAPSLLVAMAGVTSRARLGVHVLNTALRHPYLLAGQLAVAQAASGGRVEVGLGAGGASHLAGHVHRALEVALPPYRERVARLEACCRVFPALWRGETVDEPLLGLRGAALGPIGIAPPPITVGGTGDRVLAVAARWADGWNVTGPATAAGYAPLHARMRAACEAAGRTRPLNCSVQLFARDVSLPSAGALVRDFAAAGATELVFVVEPDTDLARLADATGAGT